MSAIHTGSVAARLRADGLYEYTGKNEDHPVGGWDATGSAHSTAATIPAQRAGSAYEQKVLAADDDLADLSDLSDLVPIPGMRAFALNYLRNNPETPEGGTR